MYETNITKLVTAMYVLCVGVLASFWIGALSLPVNEPGYHQDTVGFMLRQQLLGEVVGAFLVLTLFYILFLRLYRTFGLQLEELPTDHAVEYRQLRGLDQPNELSDAEEIAAASRETRQLARQESVRRFVARWKHALSHRMYRSVPFCWYRDKEPV